MWNNPNWTTWPIHQADYANTPSDQIDWAALAKQWIAQKETGGATEQGAPAGEGAAEPPPPPPPPHGNSHPQPSIPMPPVTGTNGTGANNIMHPPGRYLGNSYLVICHLNSGTVHTIIV